MYGRCYRCVEKGWECSKLDFVKPRHPAPPKQTSNVTRIQNNGTYNSFPNNDQDRNEYAGSQYSRPTNLRRPFADQAARQQRAEQPPGYNQQLYNPNLVSPLSVDMAVRYNNIDVRQQPLTYSHANPSMGYVQPFSPSIPGAPSNFFPMPYPAEYGQGLAGNPFTATPFNRLSAGELMFTEQINDIYRYGYSDECEDNDGDSYRDRRRTDTSDESPSRSREQRDPLRRSRKQQRQ